MFAFFSALHVLLCVFMIFVILLQPGKDAGMGSALGGGASTTVFGGRGAVTFLGKVTAVCAIAYFLTSLGLSFVGLKRSVVADVPAPPPIEKKDTPAAPTTPVAPAKVEAANPAEAPPGKPEEANKPATTGTEAVPANK